MFLKDKKAMKLRKASKLLLLSSVSALTINMMPAVAKPSVELYQIEHIQPKQSLTAIALRTSLYDQVNGYKILPRVSNLKNKFKSDFSNTLIFNIQPIFHENTQENVKKHSYFHSFFEITMMFNDKLQQIISLFNFSDTKDIEHTDHKSYKTYKSEF